MLIERLGDDLRQAHAAFPGAELGEVRNSLTSQALDDEIPPAFLGGDRHRAPRRGSKAAREERACAEVAHCREKHLHRYLAEYDFRYNHRARLGYSDAQRTAAMVKGAAGKRLTYQQPHSA